jgi:hypothetical protein
LARNTTAAIFVILIVVFALFAVSYTQYFSGTVPWLNLTGFPAPCPANQFINAIASGITCATPSGAKTSGTIIANASSAATALTIRILNLTRLAIGNVIIVVATSLKGGTVFSTATVTDTVPHTYISRVSNPFLCNSGVDSCYVEIFTATSTVSGNLAITVTYSSSALLFAFAYNCIGCTTANIRTSTGQSATGGQTSVVAFATVPQSIVVAGMSVDCGALNLWSPVSEQGDPTISATYTPSLIPKQTQTTGQWGASQWLINFGGYARSLAKMPNAAACGWSEAAISI